MLENTSTVPNPAAPVSLEELFDGNFQLPPLPGVAARLFELVESGTSNAGEVTEVLVTDMIQRSATVPASKPRASCARC